MAGILSEWDYMTGSGNHHIGLSIASKPIKPGHVTLIFPLSLPTHPGYRPAMKMPSETGSNWIYNLQVHATMLLGNGLNYL